MSFIKRWISAIYLLIIILIINLIFSYTNIRLDITKDRIYSLSAGTKNILKKIKDPLLIDIYASKELPAQAKANCDYLKSMIKDYSSYSDRMIKYSYTELDSSEKSREMALKEGIMPVRFDMISKEKFEQKEGFIGFVIRYREKKRIIPFVSDVSNLEYQLSSTISNLINENKKSVYFISNSKAITNLTLPDELSQQLSMNYELKATTLEDIYRTTETLTVCFLGPNGTLDEKELFYFDQLLVKGSKIFLAYDKKYTSLENFFTRDNPVGIEKTLEANNIHIKNTLIADKNSAVIQVSARQGMFVVTNIVKYPYFILTTNINRENPSTGDIYSLTIPFASPLYFSTGTTQISFTPTVKTSKQSIAKKENAYISINPFEKYVLEKDDISGQFDIAGIFYGNFTSAFNNSPNYDKKKSQGSGSGADFLKTSNKKSMLYLITSSKFIVHNDLNPENSQFFINIINYLNDDNDLLSIRNKNAGFIPLKDIPDNSKIIIKYLNIFMPVIIVISFGLYFWQRKKIKIEKIKNFV
jgi:gliding-associated putative ABC transporter substrate-binding component GldG